MLGKKVRKLFVICIQYSRFILATEFRIIVQPGGTTAKSPTVHCGPELTRTPRKNANKRCVVLRAPTTELKAVWQNLLQRQT